MRNWFGTLLVPVLFASLCLPTEAAPCDLTAPVVQQVKCLLRPVKKVGALGPILTVVPAPLDSIPGKKIDISKAQLQKYLDSKSIRAADIGGDLSASLSKTSKASNLADKGEQARYFIIHDTSTPNLEKDPFPNNINDSDWPQFQGARRNAHIYVSRIGTSKTMVDLKTAVCTTKFDCGKIIEKKRCGSPAYEGLFLGIENDQPRRSDPELWQDNDAIAPDPGFTDPQLERLALIYIAASIRKGTWLIPAYHAVLDTGCKGGHDDPQKFDLNKWAAILGRMGNEISAL
jgi:hypothetical protein